ncbi:hypothetical protein WJ970_00600 [Achromobacter xylosoxidans]
MAVASYGQQARLLLTGAQGECSYIDLLNDTPCMDAIPRGALKQAIRLYAEQAARGSSSGHASLRLLASWALGKPERARALIDDPVAQGLLVSYALARLGDIVDGQPDSAFDAYANFDATGQPGLADSARGAPNVEPNPTLKSLVSALQALDVRQVANADRVAALAYRITATTWRNRWPAGWTRRWPGGCAPSWRCARATRSRPRRPMPAPPPRSRAPMAASTPTARDVCGPNRAC